MIELIDIYKSFNSKHILRGVNLNINKGENMVIIGGSGTGKSVTLKHIIGLLSPDRGKVIVDGIDIGTISEKELNKLRKRFGMLFQEAALFDSLTIGENVAFPLIEHTKLSKENIREKVKGLLREVNLEEIEDLRPDEISGGMRKRVGLARAIAMEPEILLYDEPTTGLDPVKAIVINDLIIHLRDKFGITSVIITHDMISALKISDRIAMLHEGKIIFTGTPEEMCKCDDNRIKGFVNAGLMSDFKWAC